MARLKWSTLACWASLGDALIDVSLKPASRDVPPGRVVRWMWQGPGRVELNASTDGTPLDFYVVSGDQEAMRRWQRRQHGPPKDQPDCQGCTEFFLNTSLSSLDSDVTVLMACNQDRGRSRPVRIEFRESLMGVPSCMDRCFVRPLGFVGMAVALTLLIALGFRLARPLCRRNGGDEAWAPQLVQCRRPPKPREVLMVSLGLTMFISTLYDHVFNYYWDSNISTGLWENVAEDNQSSNNVQGAVLVSLLSLAVESLLRMLALALFRTSLACSRLQKRWHAQAPALVLAVAVVMFCIAYPFGLAASTHLCGYIRHLSAQILMSQVIRGLPMAVAVTSLQYLLLKVLGSRNSMGGPAEMAVLNS